MKSFCVNLVIAISVLVPLQGAFAAKLENIHLEWKPTSAVKPPATMANVVDSIAVEDFVDARTTGELIGENREDADKGKVLRVTTKDNVTAFVTENARKLLERAGFKTVKSDAERVIGGELRQLFVTETNTYKGEIVLKIWIKDRRGQELWNSVVTSRASRWGGSYKAENYYEVLSDSIVNAVNTLFENADAQKALTKR